MRLPFLVLTAVLAMSGCATAIRGNTQRIAIATDPPGARCELRNARGEAPVVVDPTPAVAEVRRDNSDLEVRCEMPQRLQMVERFASSWSLFGRDGSPAADGRQVAGSAMGPVVVAEAAAAGAVGAVGTVGVMASVGLGATLTPAGVLFLAALPVSAVVDHGSGASYTYPSAIAVLMPPAEFPDEAARATYFDALERARRDGHALRRKEREASCQWRCASVQEDDDAELARHLALQQSLRARTRIAGTTPEAPAPRTDPAAASPPV